jgi:hypothetical protein
MQSNPIVEWQRLSELYREKSDEELQELAADFADLTEAAQQALRGEMRSRGLGDPEASRGSARDGQDAPAQAASSLPPSDLIAERTSEALVEQAGGLMGLGAGAPRLVSDQPEAVDGEEGPHEYTWKTPLCECETQEQAWQLTEALKRAGIESWIESRESYSPYRHVGLDARGPRVMVAADRLEEAQRIAAQPIPQEIVDQARLALPEYEPPACPNCGATEPVLEGVDPANTWRCEACGKPWEEPATGVDGGPEGANG